MLLKPFASHEALRLQHPQYENDDSENRRGIERPVDKHSQEAGREDAQAQRHETVSIGVLEGGREDSVMQGECQKHADDALDDHDERKGLARIAIGKLARFHLLEQIAVGKGDQRAFRKIQDILRAILIDRDDQIVDEADDYAGSGVEGAGDEGGSRGIQPQGLPDLGKNRAQQIVEENAREHIADIKAQFRVIPEVRLDFRRRQAELRSVDAFEETRRIVVVAFLFLLP